MADVCFENRFEHPAGGYKKIFETCEELSEPLPATVTGLFAYLSEIDCRHVAPTVMLIAENTELTSNVVHERIFTSIKQSDMLFLDVSQVGFLHF